MAPVSQLADMEPEEVIRQMEERIDREPGVDAGMFWTATGILMGLRYVREEVAWLLRGVRGMKESSFYQMILEEGEALGVAKGVAQGVAQGKIEGKIEEAKRILLILGRDRWGEPDPGVVEAIESLGDLGRVEVLVKRSYRASSWEELLAESPTGD